MKKYIVFMVLTILCTLVLSSCSQEIEDSPVAEVSKTEANDQIINNDNDDEESNEEETIVQIEKDELKEKTEDKDSINDSDEKINILVPRLGYDRDIVEDADEKWKKGAELIEKMENGEIDSKNLTQEQKDILNFFDKCSEGMLDILGRGCSWYCGGGPYKVMSSSNLKAASQITYIAKNAHDFDLRTAWVEGGEGYGIGEYIEYYFTPFSPRVTQIKIFNGYMKSKELWKANARIKKLKMYINGEPYAILKLEDTRALQTFGVEPLQASVYGKDLVLKFEIAEVYKGEKYEDSVITELYFDGLDVHCFVKGTMIKMADGSMKPIEQLKENDKILSYNFASKEVEVSKVLGLAKEVHSNLVKLDFGKVQITSTDDHPFFSKEKGWCSLNPVKSQIYENMEDIKSLEIGDEIVYLDNENKTISLKLLSIEKLQQCQETYTITKLDKNNCFFANNLLVGIEDVNID